MAKPFIAGVALARDRVARSYAALGSTKPAISSLFLPHLRLRGNFGALTRDHWKALRQAGFRAAVIDRDNTIQCGPITDDPTDAFKIEAGVLEAIAAGAAELPFRCDGHHIYLRNAAARQRALYDDRLHGTGTRAPDPLALHENAKQFETLIKEKAEAEALPALYVYSNSACDVFRDDKHVKNLWNLERGLAPYSVKVISGENARTLPTLQQHVHRFERAKTNFRKPSPMAAAVIQAQVMADGILPHETVMIGDRVMTDVVMAHACGMAALLVDPLEPEQKAAMRALVALEQYFVNIAENTGAKAPHHPLVKSNLLEAWSLAEGNSS